MPTVSAPIRYPSSSPSLWYAGPTLEHRRVLKLCTRVLWGAVAVKTDKHIASGCPLSPPGKHPRAGRQWHAPAVGSTDGFQLGRKSGGTHLVWQHVARTWASSRKYNWMENWLGSRDVYETVSDAMHLAMFLRRKVRVLFAFLVASFTWVFQDRLSDIVTPRYFLANSRAWL